MSASTKEPRVFMTVTHDEDGSQLAEVKTLFPDGSSRKMTGAIVEVNLLQQEGYDDEVVIPAMRAMELAYMFNRRVADSKAVTSGKKKPGEGNSYGQCDLAWLMSTPFPFDEEEYDAQGEQQLDDLGAQLKDFLDDDPA